MENTYPEALRGMQEILPTSKQTLDTFNRKQYPEQFQKFYEEKFSVFQAVENSYHVAIDKEQFLFNMAEAVKDSAYAELEKVSQKRKKEARLLDVNLCLVVYVLPAILQFAGESSKPLADEIVRQWKETFPKTNISAASYETIEAGFHRKWCYITTAVCETFGKPDDCYELTLLRGYRDGYLMEQPDGEAIIREYYDVAPTIVKRIDHLPQRKEIYRQIWDEYLSPCIGMIENNQNEACRELYIRMVRNLQEQYFYSDKN